MHICLMSDFSLYIYFFHSELPEKSSKQVYLLHNKAKNFVSLHVLKAKILSNGQLLVKAFNRKI